jgi:hypothetical protein
MEVAAGLGAVVGRMPVPEAGLAARACAQAPTTTSESLAAAVLVKVVFAE